MRTLALAFALLTPSLALADQTIHLAGDVPASSDLFFFLEFDVPAGTAELEVRHDDLSAANILDWGLDDPSGWRGWGGGNEEPIVVNASAASRSYVPGPLTPGKWRVVVGKAKLVESPARYSVDVTLRTAATLAPQARAPYTPVKRGDGKRWYAGDLHVHSRESGDAKPTLDAIADYAISRHLDFVELSDHNTVTQDDFIQGANDRHPGFLLMPGIEFTTYFGHANAIGATKWADHRLGAGGDTNEAHAARAIDAIHGQGALFSINHPVLDLGDKCIGCAWKVTVDPARVDGVEIETGGYSDVGYLFFDKALEFRESLCSAARCPAFVGGSDDHSGGTTQNSPIGSPTTLVLADELSPQAIVEGIKAGHTVVKLNGPDDPMVELEIAAPAIRQLSGETSKAVVRAHVTGADGMKLRWVKNGKPLPMKPIAGADATLDNDAADGERWRAEVWKDDSTPATLASDVFVHAIDAAPMEQVDGETTQGCGCATSGTAFYVYMLAALAGLPGLASRRREAGRAGRM